MGVKISNAIPTAMILFTPTISQTFPVTILAKAAYRNFEI